MKQIPFRAFLIGGLLAGVASAICNLVYYYGYLKVTGMTSPELINFLSVTITSVGSTVAGALVYYALARNTDKATTIFVVLAGLVTLLSLLAPMQGELPDGTVTPEGFFGLTAPMHLIAGVLAILFLPLYVLRQVKKSEE